MASSKVWKTSPPVFVLTADWAPYPIRVATRRMSVTDRQGKMLQFHAGLEEPEVEESVSLEGQEGGPRDVTVRCLLPVDVSEIMSRGHTWFGVEGELSLHSEAEAWEERLVLVRGRVSPVSWGPRGTFLELQLTEPAWEDPALWPPPDASVTRKTWPDAPEGSLGRGYSRVYGAPGAIRDEEGTEFNVPATPCVAVDEASNLLMVAGHRVYEGTVTVRNVTHDAEQTYSVTAQQDGLGRTVSVVDFTAETLLTEPWTSSDSYYVVDWGDGAYPDEGNVRPDTSSAVRALHGLGDLTLSWVRKSGLQVDLSAWRTARDALNRTRIGGFADGPVAPLDFIRDVVLPLAPDLALAPGPDGIRPVLFRPLAGGHALPVTMGATFARTEQPTSADSRPVTDVTVAWGYDAAEDLYKGRSGVTSGPWAEDLGPSTHARAGRARHGREERLSVESRWLWTAQAASSVALATARLRWAPPEQDGFTAPLWAAPLFALGEVVELTDEETSQVEVRYWVVGRAFRAGRVEVKLAGVEDPVSAPRRA